MRSFLIHLGEKSNVTSLVSRPMSLPTQSRRLDKFWWEIWRQNNEHRFGWFEKWVIFCTPHWLLSFKNSANGSFLTAWMFDLAYYLCFRSFATLPIQNFWCSISPHIAVEFDHTGSYLALGGADIRWVSIWTVNPPYPTQLTRFLQQ